jgi:hypothetical protein
VDSLVRIPKLTSEYDIDLQMLLPSLATLEEKSECRRLKNEESVAKLPVTSLKIEKIPDQNLTWHFKKFSKPYKTVMVMVEISKLEDVWE